MSFYTSCKSVARDIVSCCDRTREHHIEPRYPTDSSDILRLGTPTSFVNPQGRRMARRKGNRKSHKSEYGYADTMPNDIIDRVFFYDTKLYNPQTEKPIYRRVLLSFMLNIDAISDEIPRVFGLPISPYKGKAVQLHNGKFADPIGTFQTRWQIYNGKKVYKTEFLVIKDSQFDMLLGSSSIRKYKLWKEDADIEKRLQY
ncbi:hypothetical protein BJY01DRAFT_180218 [Aspergillus pseudoustus]|uniref:Uncharacterized protein n=1 Tax=Aspergillus pseudoustus TaxID=1810923 RepID=A0ABR4JZY8_9EURO